MNEIELKKLTIKILKEKTCIDYGQDGGDEDYVDIPFMEIFDVIKQVVSEIK